MCVCAKLCEAFATARRKPARSGTRENAVSVYGVQAAVYTRGARYPCRSRTLRPPTTREFGNVDTGRVAGVESLAKSSRGNLLKISTQFSDIVLSL